jgi:hypothetical protein
MQHINEDNDEDILDYGDIYDNIVLLQLLKYRWRWCLFYDDVDVDSH